MSGKTGAAAGEIATASRKLNVGCGPLHLREGWINMDLRPFEGVDQVRDATVPFDDLGPLSHVYSEHFLEHLPLDGGLKFLRNSLTALRPGGRMRLSTPGLEYVMLTHFNAAEKAPARIVKMTMGTNRAFHGWGHQFLWSGPMLKRALTACGFEDVEFSTFRESDDPEFAGIELHGAIQVLQGMPNFWILEGRRGATLRPAEPEFFRLVEHEYLKYVRSGH